jgi:hypothetical protein
MRVGKIPKEVRAETALQQVLSAIEKYEPYNMETLVSASPFEKSKFYELFPSGSEGHTLIREAMDVKKNRNKLAIAKRLSRSTNVMANIVYLKLAGTAEERRILSNQAESVAPTYDKPVINWGVNVQQTDN